MCNYESELRQYLVENEYFKDAKIRPYGFRSRRIWVLQPMFDFFQTHRFPQLAEGLRMNTTYALKMIQRSMAKRMTQIPHVVICFRTKNLPLLDSTQVSGNRDLMSKTIDPNSKALVKAVNIQIMSMCEESNFVIGSIYKCSMEKCGKERIFNHFIFGVSQPISCYEHRNSSLPPMTEEINERICTNRKIVHLKSFKTGPCSTTFRAFFYRIVDPEIYHLAKLGARIKSIEGIAVCWETVSGIREVGIDVLNCEFENPFEMVRDPCGPRDYSEEILRLRFANEENSPSSLVFALSEYFAIDILGKGNLMLKMSLLISLMSLRSKSEEENEYEYIRHKSIMVVGNYLDRVRNLFVFASKFAHNHFIHSSQVSASVVTRKNKNTFWNDAGSLQLATNGVCIIDAEKVSEKDHNDLVAILEHNKFPVKLDKDQSSKEETLNIAVWVSQSLKALEQIGKNKPIPLPLFPLVIHYEEEPSSRGESPLSSEDWRLLFTLASHVKLIFTKEAKDILENYFSTARNRLRDKCDRQAIFHLMTSAAALAKLCLRHHVLSFDAILAISLFEESSLIKYGRNILAGTDFPRFERLVQLFQQPGGSRHIENLCESLEKNLDRSFDDSEMNEE